MTMQILKISLYGKNGERRDIDLKLGAVNIITGASQRGKTSLIHIVEYCLGASECMVAEGHIRQTVDWYSILLQFPDCQVFIARSVPLPGMKSSSAAHMLIEKEVIVPIKSELINSTNIDSVVSFLTSKIGVPEQITEVPDDQTRPEVKISFRHSRYYLFQSQNEIANNEILFHQQARPHIPQNIKDTLPYFIGAAEDDRLSDIEKLRSLKRDRMQLLKQIREIDSLKGEGLQKGYTFLVEAAEIGMYMSENLIPSEDVLIRELKKIAQWVPSEVESDNFHDPLVNLEREHQALLEKKNDLKLRLREAQEFSTSESGFEQAVNEQVYRLKSVGLFQRFNISHENCPVCDSPNEGQSKFEDVITRALNELAIKLEGVGRSKPRVSGYVVKLNDEQSELGLRIRRTRLAINKIREQDHELSFAADLNIKRARLAGKASLYIESVNWNEDSGNLLNKVKLLDEKIGVLTEELDPSVLEDKLNAQLNCIAEDMTRWARELKLGYSARRIRLDANKLTVVADTPDGPVTLAKMGSGENWMGYHLVTYLALAKWFIEQSRPVGRFIFFDQPTQAFYPADNGGEGKLSDAKTDEDRAAVIGLYKLIFNVVESLAPNLQVIITDHADIDEPWFQAAISDHKWRGDYALIPKHWYESE